MSAARWFASRESWGARRPPGQTLGGFLVNRPSGAESALQPLKYKWFLETDSLGFTHGVRFESVRGVMENRDLRVILLSEAENGERAGSRLTQLWVFAQNAGSGGNAGRLTKEGNSL